MRCEACRSLDNIQTLRYKSVVQSITHFVIIFKTVNRARDTVVSSVDCVAFGLHVRKRGALQVQVSHLIRFRSI